MDRHSHHLNLQNFAHEKVLSVSFHLLTILPAMEQQNAVCRIWSKLYAQVKIAVWHCKFSHDLPHTPHTTTGCTPAELFLNYKPRIRLSLLKPSLSKKVKQKQDLMKSSHDGKQTNVRAFEPGDSVMVRNSRGSQKWKPGTIMQRLGPISYMVKVQDNMRHMCTLIIWLEVLIIPKTG